MDGSGAAEADTPPGVYANFLTYLPGGEGGQCVVTTCDSVPLTAEDVKLRCTERTRTVLPDGYINSNGNPVNTTEETVEEMFGCTGVLQQSIIDAGLAGETPTEEELAAFLTTAAYTNVCHSSETQGEVCTILQERVASSPSDMPDLSAEQDGEIIASTERGNAPRSSDGLDQERETRSPASATIKDRVGQWMLNRIESAFLPRNRTQPRDKWWKRGKELFQNYLTYVKGLEQPYPQIERAAVLSNQWRMEDNQLRLEMEQKEVWRNQYHFAAAMALAALFTLFGSCVAIAQACRRSWVRWTGQGSERAHSRRSGKRKTGLKERMTDCGSSSEDGDGDCQPTLIYRPKRKGKQPVLAIEQEGGKWYMDPATCKGTSSPHQDRSTKHSPPLREPLQKHGQRGQKRLEETKIELLPRPPKVRVVRNEAGSVAAEPTSYFHGSRDGARKEARAAASQRELHELAEEGFRQLMAPDSEDSDTSCSA